MTDLHLVVQETSQASLYTFNFRNVSLARMMENKSRAGDRVMNDKPESLREPV